MQTKDQQETQAILGMAERLAELEKAVEDITHLHRIYGKYSYIKIGEVLEKVRKKP